MFKETAPMPARAAAAFAPQDEKAQGPRLIVKRNGEPAAYDRGKIKAALMKAGRASGEFGEEIADSLARLAELNVIANAGPDSPAIEYIQNEVERALIDAGYIETARRYITYRLKRTGVRAARRTLIDVQSSVDEYINRDDWRVNANANQGYSLGGLILNTAGKVTANYWLDQIYPEEVGEAHRAGDVHIHDLDMLSGYCAGWSLRTVLAEGLNGVPGKIEAGPAKHLSSALGQIVNFLGALQNEWAGAQAFSSFDTYLAPYVREDGLDYQTVRQSMQEFIFNLNAPSRWGTQTPFTNLTFDWTCPDDLAGQAPVIAGRECGYVYGDLAEEMAMINRAFIEVMCAGDAKGRVFTFPIPTYNITREFVWDDENANRLFAMTAKYGLPYFQNFINSDLMPSQIRSMCCRLQLDLRELLKRGNGLFGSAEQTGSIGVVTINCARLGFRHRGDEAGLL
jgi:ribonucleoside-triphosphate reductase